MKQLLYLAVLFTGTVVSSCGEQVYLTNGENIYRKGRNQQGEKLLDKKASRITFVHNCKSCHGASGDAMRRVSIKFSDLSDPKKFTVPYTDSLFFRFLDEDLKSNGKKANIGVIWKMNDKDKEDLLAYLKTL